MGQKYAVIVRLSIEVREGGVDRRVAKTAGEFTDEADRVRNGSNKAMKNKKQVQSQQVQNSQKKVEANYARIVEAEYEWYGRLADRIDADPRPRPAGAQRP